MPVLAGKLKSVLGTEMTKKIASPRQVAEILIDTAGCVSRSQFKDIAAHALQDNSPKEVAAVARHMPRHLRELLPTKYLH